MMARPTKLTKTVHNKIVKAIRDGLTHEIAANVAGIGITTFYRWKAQGENDAEKGVESGFREFWEALQGAMAEGEAKNAAIISRIAKGGSKVASIKVVKKQEMGEDGQLRTILIEETVTTRKALPDWRAAAFVLERRHPERWGRNVKVDANVRSIKFSADDAAQAEKELSDWMTEHFEDESQEKRRGKD